MAKQKRTTCFFCVVAVFLTVGFFVVAIAPLYAADDPTDLADKYDALKDLQKKEEKYRNLVNTKDQEHGVITQQIQSIESQSTALEKDIAKNEEEIHGLTNEINATTKEIENKKTAIATQKDLLAKILRDSYQGIGGDADLNGIFGATREPLFVNDDNRGHTVIKVRDIVDLITTERNALVSDKENLAAQKQSVADTQYKLEERNSQLESTKNYKAVLASQVQAEKDKYATRLNKVLEEQLAIQNEINAIATASIDDVSFADLPSKDEADFSPPVKKPYVITQGYGKTSFSHNYKGGHHNGVDFVAKGNQKIIAAADGKVLATGNMGRYGYGKWIVIDHGNGFASLYGHMSSVSADKGDKLDKGDKIGVMGSTGFSTGAHVHFTLFMTKTFRVTESTSVPGVYIPVGATVNPSIYL